jgi:hypothetical protein
MDASLLSRFQISHTVCSVYRVVPVCGGRFGPVLNCFGPLWRNIMNKGINPIQDRIIRDVKEPAIAFKHVNTRSHRALFPFLFKRNSRTPVKPVSHSLTMTKVCHDLLSSKQLKTHEIRRPNDHEVGWIIDTKMRKKAKTVIAIKPERNPIPGMLGLIV